MDSEKYLKADSDALREIDPIVNELLISNINAVREIEESLSLSFASHDVDSICRLTTVKNEIISDTVAMLLDVRQRRSIHAEYP